MNLQKRKQIWILVAFFLLFCALIASALKILYERHAARILASQFPIQGVDVSHYQGDIDWNVFAQNGIHFAYIKATEGSSHIDEYFAKNWAGAEDAAIISGAYHFFSFESPAATQAELYIRTVGSLHNRLVPAVDVEYYSGGQKRLEKEVVQKELRDLLLALEEYYGAKPFIYSTRSFYKAFLKDAFSEYPFWIRNVYMPPALSPRDKWMIWQYSDHGVLDGYSGGETFIDKDAFRGTQEQFAQFILP